MTPQRVTLITLGVQDLERAKAYYAALGWTPTQEMEGAVVFYQMHGAALGFFGKEALAGEQKRSVDDLGTGAVTHAQNFPDPEQVDEMFARAVAAGGTPLAEPARMDWGGYSSYVADPDGHVWEYAFNPFWPLQPDGSLTLPGTPERIDEPALTTEDEAQIAALLQAAFGTDFGGRSFFHQRPHHRHLIRHEGRIVAHLSVMHRAIRMGDQLVTIAGIADVATDTAARGKGYASTLLQAAMAEAKGSPTTDFVVLFGDRPIYAGHGFVSTNQRIRYLDMDGARSGEAVERDSKGPMIWPAGEQEWDTDAIIDLMGDKF